MTEETRPGGSERDESGGLLPEGEDVLEGEGEVEVGGDPFAGTQGGQTARRLAEQED